MSTRLEQWLSDYKTAWETRDADLAARLFTPDASYREQPFEAAHLGQDGVRNYWSQATADQRDVRFTSSVLAEDGPMAMAHWHAVFTRVSSGVSVELDGIFLLEFAEDGRCRDLKEWWHAKSTPPLSG
jgi:ketosteroid isomerase-like protein